MKNIVIILILCVHFFPLQAQNNSDGQVSSEPANEGNLQNSEAAHVVDTPITVQGYNYLASESATAVSANYEVAPQVYNITDEELPEAVTATLKNRYYSRGFQAHNIKAIQTADGDQEYSVDLIREDMALFVVLDKKGRVFKAALSN